MDAVLVEPCVLLTEEHREPLKPPTEWVSIKCATGSSIVSLAHLL
jgi:hypothetical protein